MVTTEVTDGCRARLVDGRYWRSLHLLITQESGEETCDAFNGYKSTYTDLNTAELNWAELSWGGIINYSSVFTPDDWQTRYHLQKWKASQTTKSTEFPQNIG